jgi:hypothetical protein
MTIRAILVCGVLTLSAFAQNPALSAGDPGLSQSLPNGVTAPLGYIQSALFSTNSAVAFPASMVVGPGGDLYFTETVGSGCSTSTTTQIFRVAMAGNGPMLPVTISQFTTLPIEAHVLAFDAQTNALYAAGTCSQTSNVYRIPVSGVPQVLNPAAPFNDPDGIAVGLLPGNATLRIPETNRAILVPARLRPAPHVRLPMTSTNPMDRLLL